MPTTAPADPPKGYERIAGRLVEKPDLGARAAWAVGKLFAFVDDHCRATATGVGLLAEASYHCFPAGTVRKPRAAFVLCDPATFVPARGTTGRPPDLIIEAVPLAGHSADLAEKVAGFLAAGTKLAWVIDEDRRAVTVHRPDGSYIRLREPAELTGEDVLPGFAVPLSAFLPRLPPPGDAP
jgi:Uma2 family endonuclease